MKAIPLKTVTFQLSDVGGEEGKEGNFDYRSTLLGMLNAPVEQGLRLSDVEMRIKIRDKLHAADKAKFVDLEDAEHAYLAKLVENERWKLAHTVVLDFVNAVTTAGEKNAND